jgi:hypothetical protein
VTGYRRDAEAPVATAAAPAQASVYVPPPVPSAATPPEPATAAPAIATPIAHPDPPGARTIVPALSR